LNKSILKSGIFLAALSSAFAVAAQEAQTSAEPASPMVVILFVVLFFGVIAAFIVWMYRSGKRGEGQQKARPAGESLKSQQESSGKSRT